MPTEAQREAWRKKRRKLDAILRIDRFRVAAWISKSAYFDLVAAQDRHGTTVSQEIEAALHLNRKLRVRDRLNGAREDSRR